MPDQDKFGAPQAASADLTASASPANADAPTTPLSGSFGATRGSGLLRGKRPSAPSASPGHAAPAAGGYTPSAMEVIKPQSEYKNPFTGETAVHAPARPEPVGRVTNEPAPQAAPPPPPAPVVARAPTPAPVAPRVEPAAPRAETRAADLTEAPARAELNILPPEPTRRPDVRWEASGASAPPAGDPQPRRDDRPTFQPRGEARELRPFEARGGSEPREGREQRQPRDPREQPEPRAFEPRQPRDPREQREPGGYQPRDPRDRQPRDPRDYQPRDPRDQQDTRDQREPRKFEPRSPQPPRDRAPQPEPAKASRGFFGWLKGLFGGNTPEAPAPRTGGEARYEGGQGDPRNRGGRGRGGQGQGGYRNDNRGPRTSQSYPQGGDASQSEEQQGDGQYPRRRRRRGGRGRQRGDGESDRGPRPEGQQGGGAI